MEYDYHFDRKPLKLFCFIKIVKNSYINWTKNIPKYFSHNNNNNNNNNTSQDSFIIQIYSCGKLKNDPVNWLIILSLLKYYVLITQYNLNSLWNMICIVHVHCMSAHIGV